MIYIGIDPDVHKSGVAFYNSKTKDLTLSNLSFFQLFDYLCWFNENYQTIVFKEAKVILEAGWLNKKSNFHWDGFSKQSKATGERIGKNVGANHETGRKIEEMLQYLKIPYELKKPTQSKVDQEYFKKLTGVKKKTNQDQRDAALLIWGL
jgi:hypothetical protein